MQSMKDFFCSRSLILVLLITGSFTLAVIEKDVPPNLARLADIALGGSLGLIVPGGGRKDGQI